MVAFIIESAPEAQPVMTKISRTRGKLAHYLLFISLLNNSMDSIFLLSFPAKYKSRYGDSELGNYIRAPLIERSWNCITFCSRVTLVSKSEMSTIEHTFGKWSKQIKYT